VQLADQNLAGTLFQSNQRTSNLFKRGVFRTAEITASSSLQSLANPTFRALTGRGDLLRWRRNRATKTCLM